MMANGPDDRPVRSAPLRGRFAGWRSAAKWVLGGLLAVELSALLFALAFANVTAEGPAKRALRHTLAILTEVDAYLDGRFEQFQQEAERTQEQAITLPDFPVAVSFTPEEVRSADREEFRALLLSRAADRLGDDGMAAFREGRASEASFFSPQGAIRSGSDFLRPRPHRVLTGLTIGLAAGAGVLAAGLALASAGYGRLVALGASVLLPAVPFLVLAVAVRFAFRLAADGVDDYLAQEFLTLGQELTWAPIRNGIIFSVGGGALLVAGAALARWRDSRF